MTIELIEKVFGELNALKCKTEKEVEEARVRFLGKKGEITALFEEFRSVDGDQKRAFGRPLNELKQAAMAKIEELRSAAQAGGSDEGSKEDTTLPGEQFELGSRHPVSIVRQQIVDIFRKFGYDVAEGPEIEDDYHVFEALNFPPNHPARDMQDTFFVSAGHLNPLLLRTHTSSVQVRAMEKMPSKSAMAETLRSLYVTPARERLSPVEASRMTPVIFCPRTFTQNAMSKARVAKNFLVIYCCLSRCLV